MNLTTALTALMPLFFDTALKGFALLVVTAFLATALFKASAATRHLVWLVGIVAILVVPVLSLTLPKWRLLPMWEANPIVESIAPPAKVQGNPIIPESKALPSNNALPRPPITNEPASTHTEAPPTISKTSLAPSTPEIPASRPLGWWIPLVWLAGFTATSLRLLMGHILMGRIASRRCVLAEDESLRAVFESCRAEMGVRQSVTLLLDPKRTIPVVWGIIRPRLLLPAEALRWDGDRLRAVLLHELAHIKRRDIVGQLLSQVACALHWWNPLVWLASWRLYIERERACDDLVLTSGIRPSSYAEHLLHVATDLSPSSWTQGCGIAMARRSSLEGRLMAVLSQKINRRRVSRKVAGAVILLGASIAVPLSMLRAQDEKPADTTNSPETVIDGSDDGPQVPFDGAQWPSEESDKELREEYPHERIVPPETITENQPTEPQSSSDKARRYYRVGDENIPKPPARPKVERRTANGPGRYELGTNAELIVTHIVIADERTNIARIKIDGGSADEPYDIVLPDNRIYALAWEVNSDVLWLLTASSVKQYNYADPGRVTVSTLKPSEIGRVAYSSLEWELGNALGLAASNVNGSWPVPSNLLPSAKLPQGADNRDAALAAAKLYWGSQTTGMGLGYNPGEPFDPAELVRLTKPHEDGENGTARWDRLRRLSRLIHRAGAEKDLRFRYLLEDDELKKDESVALALKGYDYSVNGNREALQDILDLLAEEPKGSDSGAMVPLVFIDEWDVTVAAYERHYSEGSDGAGSLARVAFWLKRQCLFPEQFDRFQARKRESEESD